ncbi:drug/metabolite transporter (DMT)-like permease [Caldalkalibacillus uzonensis]|uniref:Drug/metabolite transporter (DMT)-like permease n=1 Tax=Caldalkalibacillus uzonensis TaxID=353224 RepID=A0ABU0CTX3_9BACI|nr:drug/metabolite transporter (DMT)-like permease [Caldalkalibacillus uzonensis]
MINIAINVLVLGLIYLIVFFKRENSISLTLSGITAFVIAGLFTSFLGRSSVFAGIRRIGSSRAAAIKNSSPIFTILFALLFLKESITWLNALGILFILTGLWLTGYEQWRKNGFSIKGQIWIGMAFAVLAAFSFGTGFAIRKMGMEQVPDPFLGALIGAIVALKAYCIFLAAKRRLLLTVKLQFQQFNLYYLLAGFATCLGSLTFFISAYFTQVSYTATLTAIEPVLTLLLSYIFLKEQEKIQLMVIISAVFIFLGIMILTISSLL